MDQTTLIVAGLVMLAVGGLFYAFVYPHLSGDIKAEKRQAALQKSSARRVNDRSNDPLQRRKQIVESLKELEQKGKSRKLTLEARIAQAGLSWSKQKFYIGSGIAGVLLAGVLYVVTDELFVTLGAAAAGALGLPRWVLNFLRKRRFKKFLNAFPDAVDVIVRGVKAGLPLGDCMRVIAQEAAEPVRTEFRLAIEATGLGLSLGEASERIVERVPVPEASFFSIVINIQQKAGGNLSEALSNLSRVLRERKKLKAKVQAVSSEAKASAAIIGSLPFIVGILVWLISPRYIELLWLTSGGRIVMGVCLTWMLMGCLVMRKMINFSV
ncbi:MAG: tight adherence protein [Methylobacteriaceae bacterium]|jgi:tight adherence protein B|nr:tight adherence protein [Methylobacteriaceae bacterium]